MKRFFPLLSAVLVLTALFSCKTEENDTPSWKELSFAFQVDEPTATSVAFTITPDDDALTYFAHYIRK